MSNDWQQGPPHDDHQDGTIDPARRRQSPDFQQADSQDWGPPPDGHHPPDHRPPVHQPAPKSKLESHDIISMILAFLFPGIGQLMLGQTAKGLVLFALAVVTCSGGGLISIASALDTYCVLMAKKRRPVGDWEFFPDFSEAF